MAKTRREARLRRKKRIRTKVTGTAERPRLTVFRSSRHIGAQVINDQENRVLVSATTTSKALRAELQQKNKTAQAQELGAKFGALCKERGIEKVVFDRNGYQYHGRVLAFAKSARENGLAF